MRQKTKLTNAIRYTNKNNSLFSQLFAIISGFRGRAETKTATVNPYQYRQFFVGRFGRRPDIQVQTVFTFS
jgi:hypothetical protein